MNQKKNKLWVIGNLGDRKAYLNISKDDAIERWKNYRGVDFVDERMIELFEFVDEFNTYEVWLRGD